MSSPNLNRKEQLQHCAVSLRQHGFLVNLAMVITFQPPWYWQLGYWKQAPRHIHVSVMWCSILKSLHWHAIDKFSFYTFTYILTYLFVTKFHCLIPATYLEAWTFFDALHTTGTGSGMLARLVLNSQPVHHYYCAVNTVIVMYRIFGRPDIRPDSKTVDCSHNILFQ